MPTMLRDDIKIGKNIWRILIVQNYHVNLSRFETEFGLNCEMGSNLTSNLECQIKIYTEDTPKVELEMIEKNIDHLNTSCGSIAGRRWAKPNYIIWIESGPHPVILSMVGSKLNCGN